MIGATLAHYRITENLGAGGMGGITGAADQLVGAPDNFCLYFCVQPHMRPISGAETAAAIMGGATS